MADKPDRATQAHAKGEINRGLDRVANNAVNILTDKLAEAHSGKSPSTPQVQKIMEQQMNNAAKTVEVFANIHETGQHPAPKPDGGGQTSNDGGSGGGWMP